MKFSIRRQINKSLSTNIIFNRKILKLIHNLESANKVLDTQKKVTKN